MASFEEAPPGDAKAGHKIFQSKCAHCHTVEKGAGHKHGRQQGPNRFLEAGREEEELGSMVDVWVWIDIGPSSVIKVFPPWLLLFQVADFLFGRQYGTTPGYSYSTASKNIDVIWEENSLYDYLLNPKEVLGPNLHGLFGKQYGTTPGYSYSTASKNIDVIWEENSLYDYLLNPKEYIPLKKKFPGMKNPQERADLIAYLKEATTS
ncbi:hypothetical protein C4D60_Mb05t18250 [Musa balbisiana]|uniref:Cytochrome c domain-containing protein n=1 Tax=Musa balbisiana TaxID=52838 RepID=A0A4S8JX12_MUSBA|nr:hypothetical protein C4D60_Mb05t18250 [Musa balbisiana]